MVSMLRKRLLLQDSLLVFNVGVDVSDQAYVMEHDCNRRFLGDTEGVHMYMVISRVLGIERIAPGVEHPARFT
jgi:hypothetical protein